jgi:hypothetical protein
MGGNTSWPTLYNVKFAYSVPYGRRGSVKTLKGGGGERVVLISSRVASLAFTCVPMTCSKWPSFLGVAGNDGAASPHLS